MVSSKGQTSVLKTRIQFEAVKVRNSWILCNDSDEGQLGNTRVRQWPAQGALTVSRTMTCATHYNLVYKDY